MRRLSGGSFRALLAALLLSTSAVAVGGSPSQGQSAPVTIQVLGTNDFHGRLTLDEPNGGAAVLAGAVDVLTAEHPNTVVAAAGDLVGASTFASFIQKDKPTIDALNAAGLDVSAVGNHELDAGYPDLTERIMAPYDPATNPLGGAEWEYLAANVRNTDGTPALPESWITSFDGVDVGFVGAVTEHLEELVSPDGLDGLRVDPIVDAANREADELREAGADIVILLVHEGAATTDISSATDPTTDFGQIVTGVDGDVDAIISGHTHLAYDHSIPVPEWEGRSVTSRPVVSSGQYGFALNQLVFEVDPESMQVLSVEQAILPLLDGATPNYPADPEVEAIVAAAVAEADVLGSAVVGEISGPFERATMPSTDPESPVVENRGGESTLGNLVAEVHRERTGSQLAFMNPGGLRADLVGQPPYPSAVTYRQAAAVQPFANTLVRMTLTGEQIDTALEQQWQPSGASRPFLRLGLSEGLTYTYDPDAPAGEHVTAIWLHGQPLDPATAYSVTANSFLAAGGDNFTALAEGTDRTDTGRIDLRSMVDHLATHRPVDPDASQRSVGVSFPDDAPERYAPGDTVAFEVSSLIMPSVGSEPAVERDTTLSVQLDGEQVGTFSVDQTIAADRPFDEAGRASVRFDLPPATAAGVHQLVLTGDRTGTTARVEITVEEPTDLVGSTTYLVATSRLHRTWWWLPTFLITATVLDDGSIPVGRVELRDGDETVSSAPTFLGLTVHVLSAHEEPGVHTYTATFVPDDPSRYAGSTSDAVAVEVVDRLRSWRPWWNR